MDIQHLVDRLEDLIDEGRHIFGTKYTMIDEERALEIIDQMRISIPEEIEKSSRIIAQKERVLAEANEQAARILTDSRQKGEAMLDQDQSVQAAQTRAKHIIEQAKLEADKITREADAYVLETLSALEQRVLQNLSEIRNGISVLKQPQPVAQVSPTASQPVHIPRPVEREAVEVGSDSSEQTS